MTVSGFCIKKTKKPYQMNLLITAIHVSCFSDKGLGGHNFFIPYLNHLP